MCDLCDVGRNVDCVGDWWLLGVIVVDDDFFGGRFEGGIFKFVLLEVIVRGEEGYKIIYCGNFVSVDCEVLDR